MDEIYLKVKNHSITCQCIDCARLDMDLVSKELLKDICKVSLRNHVYEYTINGNPYVQSCVKCGHVKQPKSKRVFLIREDDLEKRVSLHENAGVVDYQDWYGWISGGDYTEAQPIIREIHSTEIRDEKIDKVYKAITYGDTTTMTDEVSPILLAAFLADTLPTK